MLNRSGITKDTYGAPKQILANVQMQASVGCVVDKSVGVVVGNRKIAKAGTPLCVQYGSVNPALVANAERGTTGYLLHDVDVTNGNANGTLLILGFIDWPKLDTDVQALIKTANSADGKKGSTKGPFVEFIFSPGGKA